MPAPPVSNALMAAALAAGLVASTTTMARAASGESGFMYEPPTREQRALDMIWADFIQSVLEVIRGPRTPRDVLPEAIGRTAEELSRASRGRGMEEDMRRGLSESLQTLFRDYRDPAFTRSLSDPALAPTIIEQRMNQFLGR